jgi:poly(3-hydroxybutyrate) depolymerase
MRKVIVSCLSLALLISINLATAQSIDAGRGELPLTVPADHDASTLAPLIVLLHGYGENAGAGQDAYVKFSQLANDYGFLFIAPNGQKETRGNKAWFRNASDACCNFQGSQVSDVDYLLAVISNIKSQYSVDNNRVYLIGHSNGRFMSYRTAYENSGTIAAIASLTGAGATLAGPAPVNLVSTDQKGKSNPSVYSSFFTLGPIDRRLSQIARLNRSVILQLHRLSSCRCGSFAKSILLLCLYQSPFRFS